MITLPTLTLYSGFLPQLLLVGYLIARSANWYLPSSRKKATLLSLLCAVPLTIWIIAACIQHQLYLDRDGALLFLLHALPLIAFYITLQLRAEVNSDSLRSPMAIGAQSAAVQDPTPTNSAVEKLSWDDVIVPEVVKEELISVCTLLRDPKSATRYGIEVPKGILLCGPPGTGKTTVAKVMANQAGMSFFAFKADEVVSKWVGESEKNLSALFRAATRHAPSVIFIDEIDSIGQQRSGDQRWAEMLLNHLLQLIDGVVKTEGLYIMAATNRPDLVDPALKRSGRLNKEVEIPLPDLAARNKLFRLYLSKLPTDASVQLELLAGSAEGYSGADIKELCSQAGLNAFRREQQLQKREYKVQMKDLLLALEWLHSRDRSKQELLKAQEA